jgi:hypothetical protein
MEEQKQMHCFFEGDFGTFRFLRQLAAHDRKRRVSCSAAQMDIPEAR